MRRHRIWRAGLVILLLMIASFLAWEFLPGVHQALWIGSFPLAVDVRCVDGHPRSVRCRAFGTHDREDIDWALANLDRAEGERWTSAEPFDGLPLEVPVRTTGRDSMMGRELARHQFAHLVVVIEMPDGQRLGKVVDIPDGRVSRRVSVSFP